MNPRYALVLTLVSLGLAVPLAASASDGVIEINQTCALNGCFPGDFPGFPVRITEPGSYRLTSNLDVRGLSSPENRTGIEAAVDDVHIDLAGFSILGPVVCSGNGFEPATCDLSSGNGIGIYLQDRGGSVRNGTVRGMGFLGIACDSNCRVESMHVIANRTTGISQSNGAAIIANNLTTKNGGYGIFGAGELRNNVSSNNGGVGIFANPNSRVDGNTVNFNGGNGIRCFDCLMFDNVIADNLGYGIELGSRGAWGRNLLIDNVIGVTTGSGFQIEPNSCGYAACP